MTTVGNIARIFTTKLALMAYGSDQVGCSLIQELRDNRIRTAAGADEPGYRAGARLPQDRPRPGEAHHALRRREAAGPDCARKGGVPVCPPPHAGSLQAQVPLLCQKHRGNGSAV